MRDGLESRRRPWWVRAILWGLVARSSAWACVWVCLTLALVSVGYAAVAPDPRFLIGGAWAFGAVGYCSSIRWIEKHGSWS